MIDLTYAMGPNPSQGGGEGILTLMQFLPLIVTIGIIVFLFWIVRKIVRAILSYVRSRRAAVVELQNLSASVKDTNILLEKILEKQTEDKTTKTQPPKPPNQ